MPEIATISYPESKKNDEANSSHGNGNGVVQVLIDCISLKTTAIIQ